MNSAGIADPALVPLADAAYRAFWLVYGDKLPSWGQLPSKTRREWLRVAAAVLAAQAAQQAGAGPLPATPVQGAPCAPAGGAGIQSERAVTGRPAHCAARQRSDSVVCERCRFRWDVNDPMPPTCITSENMK